MFYGRLSVILGLPPNELGDFLAGVFGPLAILWLILGFFQQGVELRQNTQALDLQAQELKNAVEQQRELVAATRSQVEAERAKVEFEQRKHSQAALPRFRVQSRGSATSGDNVLHRYVVRNIGAPATEVRLNFVPPLAQGASSTSSFSYFESGTESEIALQFAPEQLQAEGGLTIEFTDALGRPGSQQFRIIAYARDAVDILPTVPTGGAEIGGA